MNEHGSESNSFCLHCAMQGFTCDGCLLSHSENEIQSINNINYIYYINNIEQYNNIQNEYINNESILNYFYNAILQASHQNNTTIKLNSRPFELLKETFECAICLEDHKHSCGLTLECGHKFCANSICTNLKKSSNCPLCRLKIDSLYLTRDIEIEQIDIKIDSVLPEQQDFCINCSEKSHCQANCGHLFCGNCMISHLHNKSECVQCNNVITSIKL